MPLAEIVYHNQQAFLKLPENLLKSGNCWYAYTNSKTGEISVTQGNPVWQEMWDKLQALGELEEIPDLANLDSEQNQQNQQMK